MQDTVSVAAINYNNAPWVIECLESIRNQTYRNVELVIIDDCSSDNSPELISEWLKTWDRPYRFIRHEKNLGVCATCNDALRNSTGKYYCLIATDDTMMPQKIEKQVEILQKSGKDTAAVYSDAYLMDENGQPLFGTFIKHYRPDFLHVPSGDIFEDLLKGNFIPAMSPMLKREIMEAAGPYDEDLPFEDYDMWLRISSKYKMLFSEYTSVRYRMRPNSLVKTIDRWMIPRIKIILKHTPRASAIRKLEYYGLEAYQNKDYEALALLKNVKTPGMATIQKVAKMKIPVGIGTGLIHRKLNNNKTQ